MSQTPDNVLEIKSVTKDFPGVRALDNASIGVRRGEVHVLAGENGAGKSTLVKILTGLYPAGTYSGEIRLNGRPLHLRSPHDAMIQGIGFVPQEISVIEGMSVAENIYVGHWRQRPGLWVGFRGLYRRAAELLGELNIREEPRQLVSRLSAGRRQLVMVARALSAGPAVLILDEATSCLTRDETDNLLRIIRLLRQGGREGGRPFTCIFITHRLEEISAVADRVTVLRDGAVTATLERGDFTHGRIVAAMVGREIGSLYPPMEQAVGREEVLRVEDLTVPHPLRAGRNVVEAVSFGVRRGEVLGLAGLVGAGRSEVLNAIYGRLPHSGRIFIHGRQVPIRTPRDAKAHGMALLTEERKQDGLLFNFAVRENITIGSLRKVSAFGLLRRAVETRMAGQYVRRLAIRTPSVRAMVSQLSGGNQQKTVLARALMVEPAVLLLDEPTKGIDIGAKSEIYRLMADFARQGMAVVLVSSELPELIAMCNRIVVLSRGRIADEVPRAEASEQRIMRAATGAGGGPPAAWTVPIKGAI